jgi:hypothetical protein
MHICILADSTKNIFQHSTVCALTCFSTSFACLIPHTINPMCSCSCRVPLDDYEQELDSEGLKSALAAQAAHMQQPEAAQQVFLYFVFRPLLDADADGLVTRSEVFRLQLMAGGWVHRLLCAILSAVGSCWQRTTSTQHWIKHKCGKQDAHIQHQLTYRHEWQSLSNVHSQ